MNYLNYEDCTLEQMAAHFRTISRSAVSHGLKRFRKLGKSEIVEKIKAAKILAKSKKYLQDTIHNIPK